MTANENTDLIEDTNKGKSIIKSNNGKLETVVETVKNIDIPSISEIEKLVEAPLNNDDNFIKDLNVIIVNKGGYWYDNIKIEGSNNRKFRVHDINMNNKDIFKLSGLISTFIEYVNYYNKVAEVIVMTPNVEQINTIHSEVVLSSIDNIHAETKELKKGILSLSDYVKDVIKYKIQNKEIIIEEITYKYYFNSILDTFRIKRKVPLDFKAKADKI